MKRNFLKRFMALAVAVTVTVSSLPTSLAFAEEAVIEEVTHVEAADTVEEAVEEAVEEIVDDETADQAEEVPASEEGVADGEVVVEGIEEVAVEAADDTMELNKGINAVPAKVANLRIQTEDEDSPTLHWDQVEGAYKYEISVVDAAGHVYYDGWTWDSAAQANIPVYWRVDNDIFPDASLMEYSLTAYEQKNGVWLASSVTNADGTSEIFYAFAPGQTYTINVRAVNAYLADDAPAGTAATEIPGEWSEAVTYTVPASVGAIADLAFAYEEDGSYYFTYGAALQTGYLYYQYSTDPTFANASIGRYYDSESKLVIRSRYLNAGTTYYVRALNAVSYPKATDFAAANVVSFTTASENKALKAITGLYLYEEDSEDYTFRFDPVLEDEDDFVLLYTANPALPITEWTREYVNKTYLAKLAKDKLAEDTPYYVVAATYSYDAAGNYVYGTPSNAVAVVRATTVSSISDLAFVEKTSDGYVLSYTGAINEEFETVEYWISESADFPTNDTKITTYDTTSDGRITIGCSELNPGTTYYVRARVRNEASKNRDVLTGSIYAYSAFTNTVPITAAIVPKISVSASDVASKKITLNMNVLGDSSYLTGFQIQRKNKTKWVTLTKTTDSKYTDTKLTKDKTYTYRVRPYYYNSKTGTTTYGTWSVFEAMTWGGSLNLKATQKSARQVKLTWTKVSGAQGYQVYRMTTNSNGTTFTNGDTASFKKYTLVKTLTKSKKQYIDKKLTKNAAYTYFVRAYKTVNGKKYYISSEEVTVDLSFNISGTITPNKEYEQADGTTKLTWQKMVSATGYVVEQRDKNTGLWNVIATLKKTTTSYTFPAATGEDSVTYQVRAYNGTDYNQGYPVTVDPYLAAPAGVKAAANAADGSITVSWNAVDGADYYYVYRTTSSIAIYDKNLKAYKGWNGSRVPVRVYTADATQKSGYKRVEGDKVEGTTLVDRPITYTDNGVTNTVYDGPTAGVKYYYYVVAVKKKAAYNYTEQNAGIIPSAASAAASATVTSVTATKKPALKTKKITSQKGKVTVQWKKVSGAEGYVVYRSTKKGSGYVAVGSVAKGTTLKYVDSSVTKGKTYYYKVKAIKSNEAGATVFSAFSSVKKIKAK